MKKLFCLLLAAMLCCLSFGALAAERKPDPIQTIPYDELPEVIDGQHHYLLLCVDMWHGKAWTDAKHEKGTHTFGNTDGIVLVTVDTRTHRVMLTSFIRDALIKKPDDGSGTERDGRINYVYSDYGPEQLCRTISEHIGVRIEKYILFDFNQIQEIIDYLGGVDITVTAEEASYLRRYAISRTATQPSMAGEGTYRFGGHAAVIYMRIRKAGGGGDFMRTQRVRTVLSTLADQCREISYEDAKGIVDNVMANSTMTNMNLEEMLEAMDYAYGLRGCTIEELRIPIDGAAKPITFNGMSAQELDWPACRAAMADYLENSFLVLDDEE